MSAIIKENGIFYLQKLVKNVEVKRSTATHVKNDYQILCLVLKNDDLLLRYVAGGETILKTIKFFENRRIQDVCFDDTGTWLLVLCYDNTIHVVPALYICDKSAKFKLLFSASEISSFTVPFSPPHECPNPQSCPNQFDFGAELDFERFSTRTVLPSSVAAGKKVNEAIAANSLYNQFYCETGPPSSTAASQGSTGGESFDAASNNNNNENSLSINQSGSKGSTPIDSQILSSSLESSCICPYPKCCVWWQTNNGDQRAIIGYSEGTICIVRLTINCPFIGTCSVERGNIEQLIICRDNNSETVTLMINTSMTEQWKLLLEQKSIGYTYPDNFITSTPAPAADPMETQDPDENAENWQFVVNLDKNNPDTSTGEESFEQINADDPSLTDNDPKIDGGALPKSISAAKARLQSLRDIGAKKIGTLKLKLAESRLKSKEREKTREQAASLALMEAPSTCPEILTTPSGPYFIVQHTQDRHLLSALHSYSDTLSVHSMDISLIPLFLYKIPRNCRNLLLTQNLIYTIQTLVEQRANDINDDKEVTPTNEMPTVEAPVMEKKSSLASSDIENVISTISSQDEEDDSTSVNLYNGFGVVSCNMAVTKLGVDCEFHERAQVSLYKFEDEQVINLHHMLTNFKEEADDQTLQDSLNSAKTGTETIISNYFNLKNDLKKPMFSTNFMTSDANVLQNKFPAVNFEQSFVITDKNVYSLELTEPPHIIFLKLVDQAAWSSCEEFCNIFNLSLPQCIEFAGDVLLRKKKVTKALLTYNIARIPPIKTALKLAMFGEVNALMHLCAMAIKNTFLLNSKYLIHPNMKYLVDTAHLRHLKYEVLVKNKNKAALKSVNTGKLCSDFSYETDEISSDLQMSSSSQFHLSNLLFLSLTERCVKDKNYVPLWNFIATNSKFHTSLACVVLSQSGLYSTAILLAMIRGACLDVFSCLVGAADQVLDVGQEWNFFMYNLSDEMFMESIIYLQDYAMEYFEAIRKNISKLDLKNLERLEKQLNPFQVVYKPVMAKMLACKNYSQENEKRFMEFCKYFIETYVIILIQTQALKLYSDNYMSALNLFRPLYRALDEQRVLTLQNFAPISTGFSHAAYVLNGCVYIWGSNGVSCALSRNLITSDNNGENTSCMPTCLDFFRDLEIDVVSANCGKSHTLFMTNNGLYAMGANNLGQLGIGRTLVQALQPMLVKSFDETQLISQIYAGQYHNAAVVDDLLYMWGWGVYGQLGQGNVENEYTPKVVEFFRGKKILEVSLGHAHTLVLCRDADKMKENSLYVFGSNHYGQLGISQDNDTVSSSSAKSLMKSLVPVKLDIGEEVKIIHTKYFSNLIVTTSNQLYTWGASPQAIRLSTQAKKRARANLRNSNEENARTDRVTVVNEPMESKEVATTVVVDDDDEEDDDVFVEKANEESQEKEIKDDIPEIKVDLAPPEPLEPVIVVENPPKPEEEAAKDALIDECTDHLRPSLIMCEEPIMSEITKIATGLYHYTLVTADGSFYTWGKNLERQLGREGSRNEILYPTKLENVSNVRDVACGADFTIILMNDGTIKACGQNNNGQCGLEIAPIDKSGIAGKLVRLRLSKRLVRIPDGSQCIEVPTVVRFPTDEPFTANHTVYTLKSLPKYQPNCVVKSSLAALPLFSQVSGHTTIDSNLNEFCKDEIPDLIRNLENQNLVDANQNEAKIECFGSEAPICTNNMMIINNGSISGQSTVSTPANLNKFSMENIFTNDFIHYCLYIFHGLYDQTVISDFSARQLPFKEYKLRVLMLNFSYIDAFKLCIAECMDAQKCIKLFEFFTKDPVILPLHEEDMKYFIYEIFRHFIRHQMNLTLLEDFLLTDLNYYLLQLSYVLYFNNNSTALEKNVFQKFRNLFTNFDNVSLENTDVIFKMISTKFNVVVCQRLIEAAENLQT